MVAQADRKMVVTGTAMWPNLFQVNKMSHKYQIDICNLDQKTVKALKSKDIPVRFEKDKEDKGHFIVAKTKNLPKVMDSARREWPEDMNIGNGSKVKASVAGYDYNNEFGQGQGVALNSVMVVDYVAYNDDLEAEEGGFTLAQNAGDDIPFDADDDDL